MNIDFFAFDETHQLDESYWRQSMLGARTSRPHADGTSAIQLLSLG